jgi:thiamine pyrophosphate-dependent acetolactate synthase large subunit-like protein
MSGDSVLRQPDSTRTSGGVMPDANERPKASPTGKRRTVAEAVIRTLVRHPSFGDGTGFHFLSGNTGSNEGPIWQAVQDITGLQGLVHGATEFVAFCMASGFEVRASADRDGGARRIPVLCLHAQVGVKYGAAGLDFLARQRQPCLLVIGDAGKLARQYGGHNSVPDYEGMLKHLGVKSVHFPAENEEQGLVEALEAAMQSVLTQPFGPVAVILDEDLLNTVMDLTPSCVSTPEPLGLSATGKLLPQTEVALQRAAALLADRERPIFVLNQEVGRSRGAREAAESVTKVLGAHVIACYAPGTIFNRDHPAWCGNTSFGEASAVAQEISHYDPDVVVVVGGPFPNNVWPNGKSEVPDGIPAIVISPDETDRTRCNMVPEVFVHADVGVALTHLSGAMAALRSDAQRTAANKRLARIFKENRSALDVRIAAYETHMEEVPIHPARIARELALALRSRVEKGIITLENVALFDEALTSSPPFLDYIHHFGLCELYYYGTPGPTLGAHGASLGVQAAMPSGLVISLFGDGGADFNEAAFIVSARENLPVKHLMIDNGGYELVSVNFARDARLRGESAEEQLAAGRVKPLHIQQRVHQNRALQVRGFVSRSTGESVFGSSYVERPQELAAAIDQMLESSGPFLLQVIAQSVHFQPPIRNDLARAHSLI